MRPERSRYREWSRRRSGKALKAEDADFYGTQLATIAGSAKSRTRKTLERHPMPPLCNSAASSLAVPLRRYYAINPSRKRILKKRATELYVNQTKVPSLVSYITSMMPNDVSLAAFNKRLGHFAVLFSELSFLP